MVKLPLITSWVILATSVLSASLASDFSLATPNMAFEINGDASKARFVFPKNTAKNKDFWRLILDDGVRTEIPVFSHAQKGRVTQDGGLLIVSYDNVVSAYGDVYDIGFTIRIAKRDDIQNVVQTMDKTVTGLKSNMDSLAKTIEKVEKISKPKGIYMYGKHIAGCYFFTFMTFVFIFLGLFGFESFHMREEAIHANMKLEVIRDEYGQVPAVKRTFEVLDSVYANPIPPKQD